MTGLCIGLTIASAFLFLGAAVCFLASLKLYTEIMKEYSQRRRKEMDAEKRGQ